MATYRDRLLEIQRRRKQEGSDLLSAERARAQGLVAPPVDVEAVQQLAGISPVGGVAVSPSSLQKSIEEKLPEQTRIGEERIAGTKFDRRRFLLNTLYEAALREAESAGLSENDAKEYAQAIVDQREAQEFEASEADKVRGSKQRISDLADVYTQKGLEQQDQYAFQPSAEQAMYRMLLGTGSLIGGAYLGSKFGNKTGTSAKTGLPRIVGPGQTLREQSGFSFPSYGRKKPFQFGLTGSPYQFGGSRTV